MITFAPAMKKWTFFVGLLLSSQTINAQLVINELMQSNIDCIMDDLNEFPDSWVELYNMDEDLRRESWYVYTSPWKNHS